MKKYLNTAILTSLLICGFTILTTSQAHSQAMVTRGQEVQLIWFGGVTAISFHNVQVETVNGSLQFIVSFQLPDGAPGVNKKAYTLPLYWISEFGIHVGTGTVTPNGKVIARFHVKTEDRN